MSEAALHVGIFCLGLLYSLPTQRATGVYFACAAAYPLGLLAWVGTALVTLVTPIPFSALGTGVVLLLVFGIGLVRMRVALRAQGAPPILALTLCAIAFGFAALLADSINVAVLTTDSYTYIGMGRSLASFNGFEGAGELRSEFTNLGVFQILVQSPSVFIGVPYLHAAAPLLALSSLACFVALAQRGLLDLLGDGRRPRLALGATALALLAAGALATPYFMAVQTVYIHTNYAAAAYLLLFCGTFWLAEVEQQEAWLPFAFAFLLAFSLQRLELPVFAVLFVLLAVVETSLPLRSVIRWLIAFALALVLWYGRLATASDEATRLLSPDRALAILLLVGATPAIASFLRGRLGERVRPWIPSLAVALPIAALLLAAWFRPERMTRSGAGLFAHFSHPAWGATWLAIPLLFIAVLREKPIPMQRLFTHGCSAALLLIVLAGSLRRGYHGGLTDSGNRMLTHVVPVLFFLFAVSLGRAPLRAWNRSAPTLLLRRQSR